MTNFTEPSNLDQLIGLWDFRAGNETADTGLDDGIAQDGETVDNPADGSNAIAATFSGDQLIVGAGTNSNPTVFDVNSDPNSSADDEQFNLDRGTLEVQFTQSSHSGGSKDVIVSRGEKDIDEDDEGFFEIAVTKSGRVEAYHNTNDGDAKVSLETSKNFFQPGDVVNVKYAFDVDTGVIMTVTNLTTGEVEVLTSDETGLTFDLTDNDDEEFTFGAREEEDGEYDKEFQGAIDYVALYSTDDTPDAAPDGVVDGEDFAEIMTPGYNDDNAPTDGGGDMIDGSDGDDDVIEGNGGDDSIEAGLGDDTVFGGEDGDTILGGLGDDLIYGDDAGLGNGAVRESFEWDLAPNDNANDFSQDTGNVTVDFRTISASSDVEDEIASNTQNVADIDSGTETVDANSSLDSTTHGSGNQATYELGFSDPVENVSFRVNDIDGDGVVKIQAFDANGNPIEVQLVGGSDLTLLDTDGVAGADTADSDGGYDADTSSEYSVLVTIPGPVSEIRIIHSQDGGNNSGINVTDVFFDVPNVLNSPDGDDSLIGNEGDDTIFGEGGDDTIIAGAGDEVTGGEGDDLIVVDANEIDGAGTKTSGISVDGSTEGTDNDTLDLTDFEYYRNLTETNDPDGDSTSGTVEVQNADGDWVPVTFAEIENLILPDPEVLPDGVVDGEEFGENMGPGYNDDNLPTDGGGDMIDGSDGDDDVIEGNGGDDTINAGQGSDTVSGGTGDDSILGGASNDGDELDGDEGDDTIRGGGGEDTIDGGVGDDSLDGGADDDTITGGDGNDEIVGGDGDDLIIAGDDGSPDRDTPPILGFPGIPGDADPFNDRDTVNSGEGNDTVFTGDDNDLVNAGTGDDEVDGGFDDDTIDGGQGNDLIIGGEGSDSLLGGQGDDTIYGGIGPGSDSLDIADDGYLSPIGPDPITDNGDDFIDGGAGNDLIFGNDDDDTILGGTGDDTISGGVDNDSISGGAGDDDLSGDHGDDFVRGNFGDDTLEGGRGSDTLLGDGDDDLIIGGAGDSIVGGGDSDTIIIDQNEVDGDGENDTAIYADGSGNGDDRDTLDLTDFVDHRNLVETLDGDGDSTSGSVEVRNDDGEWVPVTFVEIETLLLPPAAPDGIVDGEETGEVMELGYDDANLPTDGGGDLITNDADSIEGNGGDDSIQAAGGDDSVDGGTGNDTIRGNDGDDSLLGGTGDDSVSGGTGDDTIDAGDGDDSVTGGSGDDVIDGGEGDDTITGSSGNDSITDLEGDNLINSDNPGSFNPDLGIPFVGFPDPDPFDNRDTITTGDGDDTINSGDDDDIIDAGDGNNVVDGGTDADHITTGSGDDSIIGGEGSDTINSGAGDDTITGGVNNPNANIIDVNEHGQPNDPILNNGDDLINAGAGDDVVFGEDDNDTIDGGAGDDTLDGGIDDDTIFGGTGDDVIVGGQGADSLDGGTGDDVFNVGTFTDPIYGGDYVEGVGDTIVGGEDVGDGDEDTLDLTGSGSLKVLFEDSIDPTGTSGESGTVIFYTDNTQTTEAGRLEFKEIENVIPCFTPGAMIATPKGEVRVESLREGDRVITRDNGIQEIRWTGNRTLNRAELAEGDNLKPILIKAGSLGQNLPERDMLVSPQHRVLVTGETPQLYFEESEVLVAAKHLVGKQGVSIMDTMRTTYIHFMFDRHEVVLSDGAWTESFQPGDQSLGSMGEASRDEIFALFPELATVDGLTDYAAARRSLKAHEAKLLQL